MIQIAAVDGASTKSGISCSVAEKKRPDQVVGPWHRGSRVEEAGAPTVKPVWFGIKTQKP
jgi:hypothetical protein